MRLIRVFILVCLFFSCNNNNIPDVSNIKVDLKIQRFEKSFFSIDTTNIINELQRLQIEYPVFINAFTQQI